MAMCATSCWQRHAKMSKKEITDVATVGSTLEGRRKGISVRGCSVTLLGPALCWGRWMRGRKNRGEREQKICKENIDREGKRRYDRRRDVFQKLRIHRSG